MAKSVKAIRVGVIGVGRGQSLANMANLVGMQVVALCDTWKERLAEAGRKFNVSTYADYDKFLEHDMDAVVLGNYFHQHAPFAIKALGAGLHVMSETSACFTPAQGVALVRAVEKSGKIYLFAENYPYSLANQEMRRLYRAGKVGSFMYGEGEYVHSMNAQDINGLTPGKAHWRSWIPATYYCTHALAPIMFITDTRPVAVNGLVLRWREDDPVYKRVARYSDPSSVILCQMDNGAVAKLLQVYLRGDGNWVRIHGATGLMENLRAGNPRMLRVVREQYHEAVRDPHEQIYLPHWPKGHEQAGRAGHGGGDYFVAHEFAEAIRRNEQPFLDVYRGVSMSLVGVQAYRSALAGGAPIEVPDLRKEADRRKYANDHWSPDPADKRKGNPPSSVANDIKPTPSGLRCAKQVWRKQGYLGD